METDVVVELVPGPVEKGRIDGDNRAKAAHGETGGGRHRVLLGDAHVDEPFGIAAGELDQPARTWHRCGERHQLGMCRRLPHQCRAESLGETRRAAAPCMRHAGQRVKGADVVQPFLVVALGRQVPTPLLGVHVEDHGPGQPRHAGECLFQVREVVPVHRPFVPDPQPAEERGRRAGASS